MRTLLADLNKYTHSMVKHGELTSSREKDGVGNRKDTIWEQGGLTVTLHPLVLTFKSNLFYSTLLLTPSFSTVVKGEDTTSRVWKCDWKTTRGHGCS